MRKTALGAASLRSVCVALAAACLFLVPFTAWAVWAEAYGAVEDVYGEGLIDGDETGDGESLGIEADLQGNDRAEGDVVPEVSPQDGIIPDGGGSLGVSTPNNSSQDGGSLGEAPETLPLEFSVIPSEASLLPINWDAGIFYDPARLRISLRHGSAPAIETNYFYNVHKITIEGADLPRKRIYIGGTTVRSIQTDGETVTVSTNVGCLTEREEDEAGLYVNLVDPKTRYGAVIVIDPGHGGIDPGAPGAGGVDEKDINLGISSYLIEIFRNENILLIPTRTEDVFVSKDDRFILANFIGDYFISIHSNADEFSSRSHGTVTFYSEHETSGILSGEELARIVQEEIVGTLGRRDRGVEAGADYRVLNQSTIPSVIAEVLFMTNPEELEILLRRDTQLITALAVSRAINKLPPLR